MGAYFYACMSLYLIGIHTPSVYTYINKIKFHKISQTNQYKAR